jgi:type I restriction enzyme, S subunit
MNEWLETTVGDIATIQQGFAFKSTDFHDSLGVPVIKIKNIASGRVDITETQFYPYDIHGLMRYAVAQGDVLIAMTGSHLDQPSSVVGRVSLFKDQVLCLLNQRTAKIAPTDSSRCDKRFLYYFMRQEEVLHTLASNASGSANQANISSVQIQSLPVLLPSLKEQKAIAETLTSLDDKIDLLQRQNYILEQMAEALYRKFVSCDATITKKTLGTIIDIHDNRRIPLSSLQRAEMKVGVLYPYYGAASIMDEVNAYLFDGDFLLLGEDGTVVDDEGYPILQRAQGKFWVNNHAHVLTALRPYTIDFLEILLRNTSVAHIVTGAVQPKISQGSLKSLEVEIPSEPHSIAFCESIAPLFEKRSHNRQQILLLEQTRDSLIPKLMNCELRVLTSTEEQIVKPQKLQQVS